MSWIQRRPEYAVAIVFVSSMFMNILDTTVVNVALPAVAHQFGVRATDAEWVVTGYLMSLAVWIPASGWLGDRFGTKRTLLAAVALFTLASALCGMATSLPLLVGARILQGVGGGLMSPVGTAMLFRAFPPERRANAARVLIIPTVVAPALGPVLGGFLVDTLSWHWVFLVNVPIGLAALAFGAWSLKEHREPTAGRFDLAGFLLAGVGLSLLLYALSTGPVLGWGTPSVVASAAVGALAVVAFVWNELRVRTPMLKLRLLTDRHFRNTNLASAFGSASFMGLLFLMPIFLQSARGESAFSSGLTTFPEALGVLASSQLVGKLYPRVGPRRLIAFGLTSMSVCTLVVAFMGLTANLWVLRGLMFAAGASMAFLFISQQAATFARVSSADTGHASAIFNTQRQVASMLGVALLATLLSARLGAGGVQPGPQSLDAFRLAFVASALMALAGVGAGLAIRDEDAASTMRGGRGRADSSEAAQAAMH
ncbi:multidrug efflux MFS transporter [Archangium violaceum]|uniref:MDR family MFS transporter n=1 Tax=Archangium violaceum TaxID=83451 RepID=UPI001950DCE9|nr:MDR family MFS transporter [Archangium violaceum]QRN99183.1 multidrug efflux MFS transporter [Archangium violaceum]